MSDRGHTDPASQYVDRLAGYDQRLQLLERSHTHQPGTPVGAMVDWPGSTTPNLWHLADGTSLLAAAYPDLFAVLGYTYGGSGASFNLPDCRSRVTVAAGQSDGLTFRGLGAKGGAETVALTGTQNASHTHLANIVTSNSGDQHTHGQTGAGDNVHSHTGTTGNEATTHTHGSTGLDNPAHTHNFPDTTAVAGVAGSNAYVPVGGTRTTNGPNQIHTHATGNQDTPHAHAFTTATASISHAHTTGNATATHNHTANGNVGFDGSGTPHENMPPFVALNKIIKILPSTAASLTTLTIIEKSR